MSEGLARDGVPQLSEEYGAKITTEDSHTSAQGLFPEGAAHIPADHEFHASGKQRHASRARSGIWRKTQSLLCR